MPPVRDIARGNGDRYVFVTALCAVLLIAQQVAGKATRDALFLTSFDISALPVMLVVAAFLSIGAVILTSRAMALFSPAKLAPIFFGASAALLLGEWAVSYVNTRIAAVLIYIHIAVIGSILISAFWLVANDRFDDPRKGKRQMSRVTRAATIGGLAGGLLAERFGSYFAVEMMIPVLAAFQVGCAILLFRLSAGKGSERPPSIRKVLSGKEKPAKTESGFRLLSRNSYIRNLGRLILLGNFAAALLDFIFKSEAARAFQSGEELMRFFAVFYTLVSFVTLIVQTGFGSRLLGSLESAKAVSVAVSSRPTIVVIGGVILIPFLGLPVAAIVRGMEAVFHGSLFRQGYELLYMPILPSKKRATKPIVDVGFDRMGDALGGGVVRLLLLLPAAIVSPILAVIAVLASLLTLLLARSLQAGFVVALEKSLLSQQGKVSDGMKQSSVMQTMTDFDLSGASLTMSMDGISLDSMTAGFPAVSEVPLEGAPKTNAEEIGEGVTLRDPPATSFSSKRPLTSDRLVAKATELRSGDPLRIKLALKEEKELSPMLVPFVIPLLAWDVVTRQAGRSLRTVADQATGQLLDHLLDPGEEFAIKRQIPRILSSCTSDRAVEGLLRALSDKRFEVRYQAGRALARIHETTPEIVIDRQRVFAIVAKEAKVDKRVWESHRLLDQPQEGEDSLFVDEVLRKRTTRSMEHVFTMLSLVLPRDLVKIAFRGLHTDDAKLHGTALEWLENVLPIEIRDNLRPFIEESAKPPPHADRSREEVLKDLLQMNQSIELNLEELRKKFGEES